MVIKCKMCGGDLDIRQGLTVCECEYCGSLQTIPVLNSEKKTNLFNRANRLRLNSEFDKAASIYASITAEFPQESEAYWGLCLCKYGIEYVDDPVTGNKVPTCHRTVMTSIIDDNDYFQAIQYADVKSRPVYETEAKRIDDIQREILQIVKNESPYDVFICYKESDEYGDRTEDSVIAYEIYESLSEKGLKVFFARVTLEEKLGQQYEPYIFAALQSSKVMIVIGTRYEYLDAVWVKNEWSRFLDMMRNDRSKKLIPCYRGIEIDELPKEFHRLQALDLSKLGWLQDLTRGVEKLCGKEKPAIAKSTVGQTTKEYGYLDRAYMYLEDGLWEKADFYADRELNNNPHSSKAYQAKMMADLHVKQLYDIRKKDILLFENTNYQKALQYADGVDRDELETIEKELTDRSHHKCVAATIRLRDKMLKATSMQEYKDIENEITGMYDFPEVEQLRKDLSQAEDGFMEVTYHKASQLMAERKYKQARDEFKQIRGYKDSSSLQAKCDNEFVKDNMYNSASNLMKSKKYKKAADIYDDLGEYRDCLKLAKKCRKKIIVYSSAGHKIATAFHIFFVALLSMYIAIFPQNLKPVPKNNIMIIVAFLGMVLSTIFAYKCDRRKTTGRVSFDIFLCFVAICVISLNYKDWDVYAATIGTTVFIVLNIVF